MKWRLEDSLKLSIDSYHMAISAKVAFDKFPSDSFCFSYCYKTALTQLSEIIRVLTSPSETLALYVTFI